MKSVNPEQISKNCTIMEKKKTKFRGFGLFRNFGWKLNLLAIAAGFLLCFLLDGLTALVSDVRVISNFDFSVSVMPVTGFVLAGWGAIGAFLYFFLNLIRDLTAYPALGPSFLFLVYGLMLLGFLVYYSLPCFLWYALPLK